MRKLASIQQIKEVRPIEGADAIEVARVNNWDVVVKKGEYSPGDLAVYCEIDSFLPIREEFEFLRKSSFKLMGEVEGFRLRTVKLRGQISQGLLLPYPGSGEIGDDVAEDFGIVKYEPPIPAQLAGQMKGAFPSFVPKTDEERVQNLASEWENLRSLDTQWIVTEKLDGSSTTVYLNGDDFGVCSRNIDLLETEGNSFWRVARQLGIEEKMRDADLKICLPFDNFAIQGELIGEGIQGNPYKLKGQTLKLFSLYSIDNSTRADSLILDEFCKRAGLERCPIVAQLDSLPPTIDELLAMADGKSLLNPAVDREGLVVRSVDQKTSFKVISNKYLLKEKG